jgi:predicted metal-binding protein/predicted O-methyltransferase YrrM
MSFLDYNPQDMNPQYLEDLATGYWFSEVLFTAVEMEIFTFLEPNGMNAVELGEALDVNADGLKRFMQALSSLGLVTYTAGNYYNSAISSAYLVVGRENYQGDSILWRKTLTSGWRDLQSCLKNGGRVEYSPDDEQQLVQRVRKYIKAMDCVAKTKVLEMLPLFTNILLKGQILDVGAGSGAIAAGFLKKFPGTQATLMDLPWTLDYTKELMQEAGLADRVTCCQANFLENWPVEDSFDLIILSNMIHACSETEISHVLSQAAQCLKKDGYVLIHDFFLQHHPAKAALFDLNMLINTYNGKVFSHHWVQDELASLGLYTTGFIPLETDTGMMIAAKDEQQLANLSLDKKSILIGAIREQGFEVYPVRADQIYVADWTNLKCQFGCNSYGAAHCPPHSPSPGQTRAVLADYTQALLLEGEPPTRSFQQKVLEAEKKAFKNGFHKAFVYWAGPCSLCTPCNSDKTCHSPQNSRPSMEGAGIDVFATVRQAGLKLRTLKEPNEFVKYFALLLLE